MSLKGVLYFAGVVDSQLGAYSWVLYDNAENEIANDSGYSSYKTKEKVEFHALIQG